MEAVRVYLISCLVFPDHGSTERAEINTLQEQSLYTYVSYIIYIYIYIYIYICIYICIYLHATKHTFERSPLM